MKIVHRTKPPESPTPKKRRGTAVVIVMMAAAIAGAALIATLDRLTATPTPDSSDVGVTTATTERTAPLRTTTTKTTVTTTRTREVGATTATRQTEEEKPLYVLPLSNRVVTEFSKTPIWNETMQSYRVHTAVDFGGDVGDRVVSPTECTVRAVWSDVLWGECVTLDAGYGVTITCRGVTTDRAVEDRLAVGEAFGTLSGVPCEAALGTVLHVEICVDGEPIDLLKALDRLGP